MGDLASHDGWVSLGDVSERQGISRKYLEQVISLMHKAGYVESLRGSQGHPIIKHRFTGSSKGCDVWLYEVIGAGHTWHTDDIDTGQEVWNFFRQYVK